MQSMIKTMVQMLVARYLRDRIRYGSLKAARFYIHVVQQLRGAAIMASALVAFIATLVLGFGFIIGGTIVALPIEANLVPYIFIGVGSFFVLVVSIGLRVVLNEQRWLETSQAYKFMDKVLATFPSEEQAAATAEEAVVQARTEAQARAQAKAAVQDQAKSEAARTDSARRSRENPRDRIDNLDLPLQPQQV